MCGKDEPGCRYGTTESRFNSAESMGSSSNNCLINAFWQMASERIMLNSNGEKRF